MKKILPILAGVGIVSATAATGVLNGNQSNLTLQDTYEGSYTWTNVNANYSLTDNTGSGELKEIGGRDSKMISNAAWTPVFENVSTVDINGSFIWEVNGNSLDLSKVSLQLDEQSSIDYMKIWRIEKTQTSLETMPYQEATIQIMVIAYHWPAGELIDLTVYSTISVKNTDSENLAATKLQISDINFAADAE